MNEKQAAKQAAADSKDGHTRFVVWVFDQGRDVFDREQMRMYGPLVHLEAAYINGKQVSCADALVA